MARIDKIAMKVLGAGAGADVTREHVGETAEAGAPEAAGKAACSMTAVTT